MMIRKCVPQLPRVRMRELGQHRRLRLMFCLFPLILVFVCLAPVNAQTSESKSGIPTPAEEPGQAENPLPETGFAARVSSELERIGAPQPFPLLWDLAVRGGIFMIPIALCSVAVVAFGIERRVALRKGRTMPRHLLKELTRLNQENNGIDPREAWDVCQKHASPLASVIQAAILKIGRPQAELERAVQDAVERESDLMSRNLRHINTCISIGPLLGLLGTVQGMIMAFMIMSTTTSTGTAKGQELAQGIYTALVTTFAGLCVAIPGIVIVSHLEARIEKLLRSMEDVFNEIVPLFERYEGKWRVVRKADASGVLLKGTTAKAETAGSPKVDRTAIEPRERKPAVPITIREKG